MAERTRVKLIIFDFDGVVADQERAQLLDRMAQRAGQRAAEIGDADTLGAAIGADPHPDDRPLAVRVRGRIGQRLVGR